MKVIIKNNYDSMSEAAALEIVDLVNKKPNCNLGLATGGTPVGMYKRLVELFKEGKVDFSKVTTFNLDEYRGLSGKHPQSYRYFMDSMFFNHININKNNTFVLNGLAENIEEECRRYDEMIKSKGGIDLQILGIGANGHIAFNEPSDALNINTHLIKLSEKTVKDNSRFFDSVDEVPREALTTGIGTIMSAKKIVLLANGKSKSNIIKELLSKTIISTQLPASFLNLHNDCTVILDKEAAEGI